jgi:ferredoxin
MIKTAIIIVLSAATAIGGEHTVDYIDKDNVKKAEAICPQNSIQVDLPTRSITAPAISDDAK